MSTAISGYVADLPVRLNKNFYPLPRPDGSRDAIFNETLRFPVEAIADEYDFSMERKVLQDYQSSVVQHQAISTKIDQPLSEFESSTESVSSGPSSTSSSYSSIAVAEETPFEMPATLSYPIDVVSNTASPLRPSSATFPSYRSSNGILQPTIAKEAPKSTNNNTEPSRPVLRLEDFENVGCSPFDMVELKSINDIEELRRLWAPQPQPNGYAL